jgi:hypothetical protein
MDKILLDPRTNISNEIISNEAAKYQNALTLLRMLKNLGLDLKSVKDWTTDVETVLKEAFPNSTMEWVMNSLGKFAEYSEAETFYLKNKYLLSYQPLTDEAKEAIIEQYKLYADSPAQMEAYELLQSTIANLNRLKELSPKFNLSEAYLVSRVFSYDRKTAKIAPDQKYLISAITSLK